MKLFDYLKKNGIRRALQVLWQYKIEIYLEKFFYVFIKNKPLQDKIIIESHNDFDSNGGAFYNYLIENGYNERYKIVWLVRKKVNIKLPKNVECVPLNKPSLKKAYHMCTAKYFTYDCEGGRKLRPEQIVVYCTHGAGGLKSVKGKMSIPTTVSYILAQSKSYIPIQAKELGLSIDDSRFVYIGYPAHDIFYKDEPSELLKITNFNYNKVILWMPTFRKGGGFKRNDSSKEQKFGIPLINSLDEYEKINDLLKELNCFLIIKIHPKQDLSNLGVGDLSNIKVLTGDAVKMLNIDNYRLMKSVDALISDYSSVAYEFLQLDRPIGYILDDINEYKIGFVVDDIHSLIAGQEIYNIDEFIGFINDVANNNDMYSQRRNKIRDYVFSYHDGNSCERLANLLNLKK